MSASVQYVEFPTGSLWSYSLDGSSYTALGVLNGDTQATWNYDRNEVEFHDGTKKISYRNQSVAAALTLADLNPQALSDLSGGLLTKTDTTGVDFATAPDQTIAAGWTNMKPINLAPTTAAGVAVVMDEAPTFTSISGATAGALTDGVDYYIIEDDNSLSGYSIVLDTAGAAGLVTTEVVTIDYDNVSPLASTSLSAGTETYVPSTIALRGYAADQGKTIDIAAVNVDSGTYNFGFKGTASDGTEEMALTFTGYLDQNKTDGAKLFTVTQTL
jgi:hypothetical protein